MARTVDRATKDFGPTLDEYLSAVGLLAKLLRRALDKPGTVKKKELREVLNDYERLDKATRTAARRKA